MQTSNVSEPIYSTANGWFRYNYDEKRLEFLNHNTKLVVQIWNIPVDQWEALPSQKEYCENIVRKAENQAATNQRARGQQITICVISAIIAAVCFYLKFTDVVNNPCILGIELTAFSVALYTGVRSFK